MKSFVAIDFETAQDYQWSICQVVLVRVENGTITNEINFLIQLHIDAFALSESINM